MSKKNKQMTINDLKRLCDSYVKSGYGDRMIVISNDSEGNGFHGLFYGFTFILKGEEKMYPIEDSTSEDINKIVILG